MAIDIFLQPGEYFVGDATYRIRTLLGSCVSMTLWHPRRRIGAMSHFMLSQRGAARTPGLDARYGDEAMELMLAELARAGVAPSQCEGKIFGGGDMFPQLRKRDSLHVGQRNGETARRLFHTHGIALVSESLFGAGHRQIIFEIDTGNVWEHQVKPVVPAAAARTPARRS